MLSCFIHGVKNIINIILILCMVVCSIIVVLIICCQCSSFDDNWFGNYFTNVYDYRIKIVEFSRNFANSAGVEVKL